MTYAELEKLPPEAYLKPDAFITSWPGDDGYRGFLRGLEEGHNHHRITLNERGVWSGLTKSGGSTTSYEGIGYHAGTAGFLRGLLASGVTIWVWRKDGKRTQIK